MRKIALGLVLASLIQCNAVDSKKQIDELALAQEIAAIKQKLCKYKVSASFFESTKNVAGIAAMGAFFGALGGGIQLLVQYNHLSDVSQLFDDKAEEALKKMLLDRFFAQFGAGAVAGYVLGLAIHAGSLPKLSDYDLLLTLAIHNVLAAGINIVADRLQDAELERQLRAAFPAELQNILKRRNFFSDGGILLWSRGGLPVLDRTVSLKAQAATILTLIPAILVIQNKRNKLEEEMQILKNALKELQEIVTRAAYDVQFAAIFAEEAN